MEFTQIQELIRLVSKHKISEVSYKEGDFKLTIRNQGTVAEPVAVTTQASAPVAVAPIAAAPSADSMLQANLKSTPITPAAEDANLLTIKSPMVGTFYRSGGPDKPPFVKIGDSIELGAKVCIIEAMKLFNEIDSEVKGKLVKILVEDATPVEYDQPLFLVEPA